MTDRNLFLAAYDVADPRRLKRALDLVKGFATGGQKSAYEGFVSAGEHRELLHDMGTVLDAAEDSFHLLRLDPRARVIVLGRAVAPVDPPFFLHG